MSTAQAGAAAAAPTESGLLGAGLLDRIVEETTLPEPAQFAVTAASMSYDDDDRLTGWNSLDSLIQRSNWMSDITRLNSALTNRLNGYALAGYEDGGLQKSRETQSHDLLAPLYESVAIAARYREHIQTAHRDLNDQNTAALKVGEEDLNDRIGHQRKAEDDHESAGHRPEAPQRRADKDGQERSAQPHCAPDDAGGEALPALVPLLGAGLDGRIEEGCAEPCRDAEHPEKSTPLLCRESRRREESAAEQTCPPQSRKAGAAFILQKAADDAPDAEKCDEHSEGIACPLLAEAVFLHDGSLKHAPRGGQACQYLDGRARRQDGPGSCFLHFVHHLRE